MQPFRSLSCKVSSVSLTRAVDQMSIDSSAVFFDRVNFMGLGQFTDAFKQAGWTTLSKFAFSSGFIPQVSSDETVFMSDVAVPILGQGNRTDLPGLRRLHFEAYTLAAADMRRIKK